MSLKTKLDQILERLDVIESSLGIKKPLDLALSLFDC